MKQIICLLISVLVCSTAVLTQDAKPTKSVEVSQSGRIINGPPAYIEKLGYPLIMLVNNTLHCGASIITTSHALTAAHCVFSGRTHMNPDAMILVGGTSYLSNPLATRIKVIKIASHLSYDPTNVRSYYDVAVLTVPKNAFLGRPNMDTIRLQYKEVFIGTTCYVAGWGWYDNKIQQPSEYLRYTTLKTIRHTECSSALNTKISYGEQICAINGTNIDVCRGDSGSALVCEGLLTGIVSWGYVPCTSDTPTVFTKVSGFSIERFIHSATRY